MLQECPKPIIGNGSSGPTINIVPLGTATSFNIATVLPDVYQDLTVDNFYMRTCTTTSNSGPHLGWAEGQGSNTTTSVYVTKSYDASTGALTFYVQAYGTLTASSGKRYSSGRPAAPVEAFCIYEEQ